MVWKMRASIAYMPRWCKQKWMAPRCQPMRYGDVTNATGEEVGERNQLATNSALPIIEQATATKGGITRISTTPAPYPTQSHMMQT